MINDKKIMKCFGIYIKLFVVQKEFKYRRDFRDETVFAIESSAIHDRDFAMHLRRLQIENNHGPIFEVC